MAKGKQLSDNWRRSLVKTITYRVAIIILDFTVIFLFTHQYDVALGFVVISNLYTSFGYYLHERIWEKISWGKAKKRK
jgi:uncharacterized membrane protein